MARLIPAVKRNWYSVMPESALMGYRGKVVVRIKIEKDATLLSQTPTVVVSSGEESLDRAAVAAIRSSAPYEQLPKAFGGPDLELRFTFFYNQLPAKQPRLVPIVPELGKEAGPVSAK